MIREASDTEYVGVTGLGVKNPTESKQMYSALRARLD